MKYQGLPLRHELKYYISYPQYYELCTRLKGIMRHDGNAGSKGYFLRSLYFDDIYESSYYQKEAGEYKRNKFRIRTYNFSNKTGDIKLENKLKVDQYIAKTSMNISEDEFFALVDGDPSFLLNYPDKKVAMDMYVAMRTRLMSPRVLVDYYRDAYVMDEGNVRITFDKELRAGIESFDIFDKLAVTVPVFPEGKLVMEVKYDDFLPSTVRKLIQPATSEHMAVSKYVLCRKAKDLYTLKDTMI